MTNTYVELRDSQNVRITDVQTDSNGNYILNVSNVTFGAVVNQPLPTGTYIIKVSTNKPWGGVNSVDALAVQRQVTGIVPLTGLRLAAADVNGSNTITSLDSLLMNRRFSGSVNSFNVGNWVFASSSGADLTVDWSPGQSNNYSVKCDIKALCYGDTNGSYQPNTAL